MTNMLSPKISAAARHHAERAAFDSNAAADGFLDTNGFFTQSDEDFALDLGIALHDARDHLLG